MGWKILGWWQKFDEPWSKLPNLLQNIFPSWISPKCLLVGGRKGSCQWKKNFKGEGCMQNLPDIQYLWQTVILKLSISVDFDSQEFFHRNFVHIFQTLFAVFANWQISVYNRPYHYWHLTQWPCFRVRYLPVLRAHWVKNE